MRDQLILGICILGVWQSGCHNGAVLHPIQGSSPKPHAILDTHGAFSSGKFCADFDHDDYWHAGECNGRWEPASPPKPSSDATASSADSLTAAWDIVYGEGYYVSHVLRASQCVRGAGRSKQGTILKAEICKLPSEKTGRIVKRGVAIDGGNNTYRLEFLF